MSFCLFVCLFVCFFVCLSVRLSPVFPNAFGGLFFPLQSVVRQAGNSRIVSSKLVQNQNYIKSCVRNEYFNTVLPSGTAAHREIKFQSAFIV